MNAFIHLSRKSCNVPSKHMVHVILIKVKKNNDVWFVSSINLSWELIKIWIRCAVKNYPNRWEFYHYSCSLNKKKILLELRKLCIFYVILCIICYSCLRLSVTFGSKIDKIQLKLGEWSGLLNNESELDICRPNNR